VSLSHCLLPSFSLPFAEEEEEGKEEEEGRKEEEERGGEEEEGGLLPSRHGAATWLRRSLLSLVLQHAFLSGIAPYYLLFCGAAARHENDAFSGAGV